MKLMPDYLLMVWQDVTMDKKKKIILHITLSSNHHTKERERERRRRGRGGGESSRERETELVVL